MNRYTIEKRDKEVVEKFRAVVESKEKRKKQARIKLISLFLVVACAGVIIFSKNFSQSPVHEMVMNKSNAVALNRVDDKIASPLTETDVQDPTRQVNDLAAITEEISPLPLVPDKPAAEEPVSEQKENRQPLSVLTPRVKTSGKIGLSEIPRQISAETDIRIVEIITCLGVKNKQADSPQNVFSLKKGAKPYVWMDVRSKATPYKLRHIYYLNGRRYCEVPLAIHYPRMRTWSNVTLRNKYETGQWRVDVVSQKGEILSQAEFTVVP